jgi:hypothetical protein
VSDKAVREKPVSEFERAAQQEKTGLLNEFIAFLSHNKKWWLGPIIGVFLIFGLLMLLGGSAAAPFIYTLF